MKTLLTIRRMASVLLLLAMVLPLSKCAGKVDPGTGKAAADIVFYGYRMIADGFATLGAPTVADLASLLALLTVFLLPLGALLLRPTWQAPILVVASVPASHFLYHWVLVFSSTPMAGGLLAGACWIAITVSSLAELWGRHRSRGAGRIGAAPASH